MPPVSLCPSGGWLASPSLRTFHPHKLPRQRMHSKLLAKQARDFLRDINVYCTLQKTNITLWLFEPHSSNFVVISQLGFMCSAFLKKKKKWNAWLQADYWGWVHPKIRRGFWQSCGFPALDLRSCFSLKPWKTRIEVVDPDVWLM